MAISNVGDRKSYDTGDDVSFDQQGYCLTSDPDAGDNHVQKATGTDPFLGTNFWSTQDQFDTEIRTGEPVAVEQDGWVNVLCEEGFKYQHGEMVLLSDANPGIGALEGNGATAGNTVVGKVTRTVDLSDDDGPAWVPVTITGYV